MRTTARILPFVRPQPTPMTTEVVRITHGNRTGTVIMRIWNSPEDPTACRLCRKHECTARGRAICLVGVLQDVPLDKAQLFDTSNYPAEKRS